MRGVGGLSDMESRGLACGITGMSCSMKGSSSKNRRTRLVKYPGPQQAVCPCCPPKCTTFTFPWR